MSINKAILIGNVGKEPEARRTKGDVKVVTFSLATSEKYNGEDVTTWHNIVSFNKTAELIEKYVSKGSKLYIEGKISNRSYEDKDGNKKYISEIIAFNVQFLNKVEKEVPTIENSAQSDPADGIDEQMKDELPF